MNGRINTAVPSLRGDFRRPGRAAHQSRSSTPSIDWMVFTLPFTQVPTLKLLFRWRISELIAWAKAPRSIPRALLSLGSVPWPSGLAVVCTLFYFLYSGIVGLSRAGNTPVRITQALDYIGTPQYRVLLETVRGLAVVSLLASLVHAARSTQVLRRWISCFVWGGALSGVYAGYQLVSPYLHLPLLPGTLQQGNLRVFSTFYEPTGLGSYTAAATFLALCALAGRGASALKMKETLLLLANLAGLALSLSRAGLVGAACGGLVFLFLSMRKVSRTIAVAALLIWLSAIAAFITARVYGDLWEERFSRWSVSNSMAERTSMYGSLLEGLKEEPEGVGQGLLLITEGGTAGFYRLAREGGLPGVVALTILHLCAVYNLFRLRRSRNPDQILLAASLAGAYVSATVTTLNYINTSDSWIWFVWMLPMLAAQAQRGQSPKRLLRARVAIGAPIETHPRPYEAYPKMTNA